MEKKEVLLKLNERNIPTLPKDMQEEKVRPIESEFKRGSRDLIRGLDPTLERIILPDLIGIQSHEVTFAQKARDFWADFTIQPNKEGILLNIATEKKKVKNSLGEEEEVDFPVNPDDFMTYQIAMQSSKVAKTESQLNNLAMYDFCLINLEEQRKQEVDAFEAIEKADLTYTKLISDTDVNSDKINWVIEILRDKTSSFDTDTAEMVDKKMLLRKLKDTDPSKFVKTVEDNHLATKAFILKAVAYGVLSKVGNDYFDGDVNIGEGKAAIAWFAKAENSGKVLQLRSKLKEMVQLKRI